MFRSVKTLLFAGGIGMGMLAMGAGAARADIVLSLDTPPVPSLGGYTWTYDAILAPNQRVLAGNFFTIYDFDGFTGVRSEPLGWTFSSADITPPPAGVAPIDLAGVPNLTWTWTGGPIVPPGPLTAVDLGLFSAESTVNSPTVADFVGLATKNGGTTDGTPISDIGRVTVPTTVPEPCTLALLGLGAAPLALRRRGRKA